MQLAETVRATRERRGLSVAALAQRSGVSRAMIAKIERGDAQPTAILLARLSAAFDMTLSELIAARRGRRPPPRPPRRAADLGRPGHRLHPPHDLPTRGRPAPARRDRAPPGSDRRLPAGQLPRRPPAGLRPRGPPAPARGRRRPRARRRRLPPARRARRAALREPVEQALPLPRRAHPPRRLRQPPGRGDPGDVVRWRRWARIGATSPTRSASADARDSIATRPSESNTRGARAMSARLEPAPRRSAQECFGCGQCLVQDGETGRGVAVAHVERWRDVDPVAQDQR